MLNLTAERNRLLRLTKAELVGLVLEERARQLPARSASILTPVEAVERLAASIVEPTLDQEMHMAAALSLADALTNGPEQAKAGIARAFAAAFDAVTADMELTGFVDELRARRAAELARRAGEQS